MNLNSTKFISVASAVDVSIMRAEDSALNDDACAGDVALSDVTVKLLQERKKSAAARKIQILAAVWAVKEKRVRASAFSTLRFRQTA